MTDKVLLITACHSIIAVTLVMHRYSLQTKQSHTSQKKESRHYEICIIVTTSLLAVGTASYKNG